MTRRKILIGNWKMYKTVAEARAFAEELGRNTGSLSPDGDYAICPPFTALHILRVMLPSAVQLGVQNVHHAHNGAYTGEISLEMVKEFGVRYAIVGHSERRHIFGESDDLIQKKVQSVLQSNLTPILCVGEDLKQRENGETFSVVGNQTLQGLAGLSQREVESVIVAYEPVWAIGTGKTPTPTEAEEVIGKIRAVIADSKGHDAADTVRILYGGSVKPDNIQSFTEQPNIDGALVGGASLSARSFAEMAVAMAGGEYR